MPAMPQSTNWNSPEHRRRQSIVNQLDLNKKSNIRRRNFVGRLAHFRFSAPDLLNPSKQIHKKLRVVIMYFSIILFLYGLFWLLLTTTGLSSWVTLTPSIVNVHGSVVVVTVLSFIVFIYSRVSRKTFKTLNLAPTMRLWWFFYYIAPIFFFFSMASFDFESSILIWNKVSSEPTTGKRGGGAADMHIIVRYVFSRSAASFPLLPL